MANLNLKPKRGMSFQFTRNWFKNRNLATFEQYVKPEFANDPPRWEHPGVTYLELGVFEGMSLSWMLQHVLTHPDSKAVGVDPWLMMPKHDGQDMDNVRERAWNNIGACSDVVATRYGNWRLETPKCSLYRSASSEFLESCTRKGGLAGITQKSLDLCMIDGVHWAPFVTYDALFVYKLMKVGGLVLFDDVENDRTKNSPHVREGIQDFLDQVGPGKVKFEFKHNYMEAYRVVG